MIRILLADDHSAIRNGLRNIISRQLNPVEFEDAINSAEVFQKVGMAKWDLLILDINLPGRSGLDVLRFLKDAGHQVPVLVFSFHHEDQIAVRAFQSGASAYLSKNAADTELMKAVQLLLDGKKYVSPTVSELLVSHLNNPNGQKPHELLSNREYQTLILLGSGKQLSQIAETLSVSVSTVNTYRARILEKMTMKSNADLIYYVVENKLI